jgi:hypothetical protein
VFAIVSGQFIGTSKPPSATLPAAEIGFFSGVSSQVSLQVAGLGVGLVAGLVAARMNRHLLPAPASSSSLLQWNHRRRIWKKKSFCLMMMIMRMNQSRRVSVCHAALS